MLKKFILVCLMVTAVYAQKLDENYFKQNGEIYFSFEIKSKSELSNLTKIISIDNILNNTVYAYANYNEYKDFLKFNFPIKLLRKPGDVGQVNMSDNSKSLRQSWNTYPTYSAYVDMMYKFQTDYPELCQIIDAGQTVQGRKILFAKISDNVGIREAEPQFMYTSSMHGDEITGYVLMLRLIDSLLTSYGSDNRITNLVNNMEIWINPNANPDGTYRSGNNTVNGAIRYNANFYDLNRNFRDPAQGHNPNGPYQPETVIMMNLADNNNFVLSANFHGGAEVVNYPWDAFSRRPKDENWYKYISHEFADTAQSFSPSTYMNGFDDGITNGWAWYPVYGGRQDYYTYFNHGREVTIEISDVKLISPSLLPAHWEYLKRSFLNYMEQSLYGIRGIITDNTGNPIKAKVTILNHDADSSEVYSDMITGNYHRLIYSGTYNLSFEAPGFQTKVVNDVSVQNKNATYLDVTLLPDGVIPVELTSFSANEFNGNVLLSWNTATETNNLGFEIEKKNGNDFVKIGFVQGNGNSTELSNYTYIDQNTIEGKNVYRLKQIDYDGTFSLSDQVELEIETIKNFELLQNYPNPFNPVTKISFNLPVKSFVELNIFDVLGNKITTLINSEMEKGSHSIDFNAESLASGIYIYKLNGINFNLVKKMQLIK